MRRSPPGTRPPPIRPPGNGLRPGRGSGEFVRPYADRGLVTRDQWNAIITGVTRELWLYGMAEYGYATDDDVPAILKRVTGQAAKSASSSSTPDPRSQR